MAVPRAPVPGDVVYVDRGIWSLGRAFAGRPVPARAAGTALVLAGHAPGDLLVLHRGWATWTTTVRPCR